MSRVYIEGQYHDCNEEDLKRWDARALENETSREIEALKEVKKALRKSRKEERDHSNELLAEDAAQAQVEAPEGDAK